MNSIHAKKHLNYSLDITGLKGEAKFSMTAPGGLENQAEYSLLIDVRLKLINKSIVQLRTNSRFTNNKISHFEYGNKQIIIEERLSGSESIVLDPASLPFVLKPEGPKSFHLLTERGIKEIIITESVAGSLHSEIDFLIKGETKSFREKDPKNYFHIDSTGIKEIHAEGLLKNFGSLSLKREN